MQNTCQSQFLCENINDPMVAEDILPQRLFPKPNIEFQFSAKVLKSTYPRVWGSFPGQYSTIGRSFPARGTNMGFPALNQLGLAGPVTPPAKSWHRPHASKTPRRPLFCFHHGTAISTLCVSVLWGSRVFGSQLLWLSRAAWLTVSVSSSPYSFPASVLMGLVVAGQFK